MLLLGNDAEMIAMDFGGEKFGFSRIEGETETSVDSGEKGLRCPSVFEEEKLHARAFAALAKDFTGAKDFGDGADDRDDLVRLHESVETYGEVRLRGKTAGDAKGKAEVVSCGGKGGS
jgi:hypothetical protein